MLECDYYDSWQIERTSDLAVIEVNELDSFHVRNRFILYNQGNKYWEKEQNKELMRKALNSVFSKMKADLPDAKLKSLIQFIFITSLCLLLPPGLLYGFGKVIGWIFSGFMGR